MPDVAGNDFLAFSVLVFVSVALLVEALLTAWRSWRGPRARKMARRLQDLAGRPAQSAPAAAARLRATAEPTRLQQWLRPFSRVQALERVIAQAGLTWSSSRLLLSCALVGGLAAVAAMAFLHMPWLQAQLAALCFAALPLAYVLARRRRRLTRIGAQLPDALDLVARALKAGHSFGSGLKMAGEELPEPLGSELRLVHEEITYGVSTQQALDSLAERVPGTDVRYFVVAVLVQRESGGNLTEVLGKLSTLIRERARLMARVRVLSAEGRLSAWILAVLPFVLGGALYLANPRFMGPMFTDPIGISILKYLAFTMLLGILVLRQIVRVRA